MILVSYFLSLCLNFLACKMVMIIRFLCLLSWVCYENEMVNAYKVLKSWLHREIALIWLLLLTSTGLNTFGWGFVYCCRISDNTSFLNCFLVLHPASDCMTQKISYLSGFLWEGATVPWIRFFHSRQGMDWMNQLYLDHRKLEVLRNTIPKECFNFINVIALTCSQKAFKRIAS